MQFLGIGFLVLIFLEIMSIVWVADWLGGATTLALMILSFVIGLLMLRRFGMSGVLLAASAARSGGNVSAYQLLWPIRYALAALMLMSPGVAAILMLPNLLSMCKTMRHLVHLNHVVMMAILLKATTR